MAISTINSTDNGANSLTKINDNFTDLDTTKADLASPTFTGTPILPTGTTGVTQTASDNSTKLATTAYVDTAIGVAIPSLTDKVQVATVTLSSADILALHNTPKTLLAAPGVGKINVIDEVIFSFTAGTQYANGNDLRIKYSTGPNANEANLVNYIGNGRIVSVSSSIGGYYPPAEAPTEFTILTEGVNDSVHILGSNATPFITGTGTAKLFIKYRIITL